MFTLQTLFGAFLGGIFVGWHWSLFNTGLRLRSNPDKRGTSGPHDIDGEFYYLVKEDYWLAIQDDPIVDELIEPD